MISLISKVKYTACNMIKLILCHFVCDTSLTYLDRIRSVVSNSFRTFFLHFSLENNGGNIRIILQRTPVIVFKVVTTVVLVVDLRNVAMKLFARQIGTRMKP